MLVAMQIILFVDSNQGYQSIILLNIDFWVIVLDHFLYLGYRRIHSFSLLYNWQFYFQSLDHICLEFILVCGMQNWFSRPSVIIFQMAMQ